MVCGWLYEKAEHATFQYLPLDVKVLGSLEADVRSSCCPFGANIIGILSRCSWGARRALSGRSQGAVWRSLGALGPRLWGSRLSVFDGF